MNLIPNMTKYIKRDYWAFLAASVLPQVAVRIQEHSPWFITEGFALLGVAALATYSWMEKQKK